MMSSEGPSYEGSNCEEDIELLDFIKTINLQELCSAASKYRDGVSCEVGQHTVGSKVLVLVLLALR